MLAISLEVNQGASAIAAKKPHLPMAQLQRKLM
jgi:hypothetical protein